ncbi:MAG: hypothetical protein WAM53_16145 [Terrimicrobiaceae bacterium]
MSTKLESKVGITSSLITFDAKTVPRTLEQGGASGFVLEYIWTP